MIPSMFRVLRTTLSATALSLLLAGTAAAQQAATAADKAQMLLQTQDAAGKPFGLKDYSGKIVLVSFFTAGCNVCSRDLKLMREFYLGNAKKNFVLLAVNIDADHKDFETYQQLISLAVPKEQRFPLIWRNAPAHHDNFGVIVNQPTHFVLNGKGQLLWKREGSFRPQDWDNLWEALGS